MPELPEVETVRATLEKAIVNLTINEIQIYLPKIIKEPKPEEFMKLIRGKTILGIDRKGKYLLLHLSEKLTMVIHLRMTGRVIHVDSSKPLEKHTHVVFTLSNGEELRFIDTRQFGRISLIPDEKLGDFPGLKTLGIEPFDRSFTREYFKKNIRFKRTKIKTLLLDQSFIAGLGNIYTDEILHRAKVHPERLASSLNTREVVNIYLAMKSILEEAIKNRGTTIKDYVDGEGNTGNYQKMLKVYNREGYPCPNCGNAIIKKRVGGRSAHFCPICQKIK